MHESPFRDLDVPVSSEPISAELRSRWVMPFYMSIPGKIPATEVALRPLYLDITPSLIVTLLSDRNWRTRITGAFFTALQRVHEVEDHIGRLLLRSDVCYAGRGYCLALARLNTTRSVDYLREYLGYYLTRKDLWFDQSDAMAALRCLDELNDTDHAAAFGSLWIEFVSNKPHWDLERSHRSFTSALRAIEELCARMPREPRTWKAT